MTINELLGKPVWQMTGEELLFLAQHGNMSTSGETAKASSKEEKLYVYGLAGIARLFGCSLPTANRIKQNGQEKHRSIPRCSLPTANRIKQSGKINRAITQVGCKIIVEAELALELAGRKTRGQ
ncbi:DUF3853 family protein [Hoylesella loescheii]|uniref:Uncharacterized protein n=1 Tax=Hoylesella loescheii DSM 19665 = JCM 12249 = ATCC 15930 TaxID=1122985 RepID=A0A069QM77_HOYLO|nr:DUF3853 family protein [Hoylesella loescheii]KDR53885.1 hypothetical protein HMPREF1991_00021 [Hoylesella loescheii DSM 19665 = JCM 12249 = ATCC 15930]